MVRTLMQPIDKDGWQSEVSKPGSDKKVAGKLVEQSCHLVAANRIALTKFENDG